MASLGAPDGQEQGRRLPELILAVSHSQPGTHAAVQAGGMRQEQPMHRLCGDQQDDQVALHFAEVHTARQERAALDAEPHGVVQQVHIQRFLHQLHRVS